jgi:hypothetical protein
VVWTGDTEDTDGPQDTQEWGGLMRRAVTQETQDAEGVGDTTGVGESWGTEGSERPRNSALLSASTGPLNDTFVPAF